MKRPALFAPVLLVLTTALYAASLTTINLRNRAAEEIIPIVEPLLAPGDVITGQGYKLFLRAPPATVDEVRAIVDSLDVAAKMLQVSVFQGSRSQLRAASASGNLEIQGDNASIGIGGGTSGDSAAGSIGYSDGRVSASASAGETRSTRAAYPVHRVRVAEGREAFIQAGGEVPYVSSDGSTVFKPVTSGFYVLARVNGDRVTLEVRPFRNQSAGGGVIATLSADTVISGRLGEWLSVGAVSEHASQTRSSGASYESSSSEREARIWIRADPVR